MQLEDVDCTLGRFKDLIRMENRGRAKGLQQNFTDLTSLMDFLHHQWQEGRFEDLIFVCLHTSFGKWDFRISPWGWKHPHNFLWWIHLPYPWLVLRWGCKVLGHLTLPAYTGRGKSPVACWHGVCQDAYDLHSGGSRKLLPFMHHIAIICKLLSCFWVCLLLFCSGLFCIT